MFDAEDLLDNLLEKEKDLTIQQRVRLQLYAIFGEKAEDAFKFMMHEEPVIDLSAIKNGVAIPDETFKPQFISSSHSDADGVYIIYKDGHYEPVNGKNSKENVKYVGVIKGETRIAVALNDLGGDEAEFRFLEKEFEGPEESDFYTDYTGKNAMSDFNGSQNTKHLIEDYKSEIPFNLLGENEYIPAVGEWAVLMMFAELLNDTLVYVGGKPIRGWYWSSTESSQGYAWFVNFSNGIVSYFNKYGSCSVRAVAAF